MKLSTVLVAALGLFQGTFAQPEAKTTLNPELVQISVQFPESPRTESGVLELINGQESKIQFVVSNKNNEDIVIAGYGGSLAEKKTPDTVYTNLTSVKVEPVVASNNGPALVDHSLQVSLPPAEFLLSFVLYVQYQEEIVSLKLAPLHISVSDPAISNWDPKLILVQLILGATAGGVGYLLSTKLLVPYLDSKIGGKNRAAKVKKNSEPAAAGVKKSNGKTYDESWIPEHHLKKTK